MDNGQVCRKKNTHKLQTNINNNNSSIGRIDLKFLEQIGPDVTKVIRWNFRFQKKKTKQMFVINNFQFFFLLVLSFV